jgi:cell shape-determining protein MreD
VEFQDLKVAIEQFSGLDKDALHIHAALLLYLVAMVAFRQTRRSRIPWLFVLLVELANEAADLFGLYAAYGVKETVGSSEFSDSAKDLWNTMLWPTVLLFLGRYTTLLQRPERSRAEEPDSLA